jgi:hypothetical protein
LKKINFLDGNESLLGRFRLWVFLIATKENDKEINFFFKLDRLKWKVLHFSILATVQLKLRMKTDKKEECKVTKNVT